MYEDTELVKMQTPGCLMPTEHAGDKCKKSDLENQGSNSVSKSEKRHPWAWASLLMAEALGARAIISFTLRGLLLIPDRKQLKAGWHQFYALASPGAATAQIHLSMPQSPSNTCHTSSAQLCAFEAAPSHPGTIMIMSIYMPLSGYPTHSHAQPPTAS